MNRAEARRILASLSKSDLRKIKEYAQALNKQRRAQEHANNCFASAERVKA